MSEKKIEITAALRNEISAGRLRFTTPARDGPEERIRGDTLRFDIGGNYKGVGSLETDERHRRYLYSAFFEDKKG